MAYKLNVARQFHSLFGAELASKTPTGVDLNAWSGVEVHANYSDYRPAPFWRRVEHQHVHVVEL